MSAWNTDSKGGEIGVHLKRDSILHIQETGRDKMTKLQEKVSSPLYIQIKSYLYSLIASGKADDQLPSENELAHRFHVSRGTAKQAIMDLVYEGEVYRRKGKGTFIRSSSIDRNYGHRLPSFTKDISSKDSDVTTTCLFFGPVDPTGYMKQLFELMDGEKVVRFKRCVSIDGEPYVVLSSYLNPHYYGDLSLTDINISLYDALNEKFGFSPTKAKDTYSIVDIAPKTADLLKCDRTSSVCFSRRIGYLDDGKAVEYVESFIRSDRFHLSINIDTDSKSVLTNPWQ